MAYFTTFFHDSFSREVRPNATSQMSDLKIWEDLSEILPLGLLIEFELDNYPPIDYNNEDQPDSFSSYYSSDAYGSNGEFWAKPAQIVTENLKNVNKTQEKREQNIHIFKR